MQHKKADVTQSVCSPILVQTEISQQPLDKMLLAAAESECLAAARRQKSQLLLRKWRFIGQIVEMF